VPAKSLWIGRITDGQRTPEVLPPDASDVRYADLCEAGLGGRLLYGERARTVFGVTDLRTYSTDARDRISPGQTIALRQHCRAAAIPRWRG
jgi:hypothetical protein